MAKSANPRLQREREAQRQRSADEARRRAYRKQARKRRNIGAGVLVAVVLTAAGVVVLASNDPNKTSTTSTSTTVPLTTTTANAGNNLPAVSLPTPAAGAAITGDTPCPTPDGSAARTTSFAQAPPMCIDPAKDYNATIHTSKGDIKVGLLPDASPKSVNNFVTLARYHYYDGLPITRIVPRGWAEVGDPKIAGAPASPGYTIPSETPAQGSVPTPLIVAMLPDSSGAAGGGLIIGLADQVNAMPKAASQIGNILDSRVDQSPSGDPNQTVQQLIDKAANKQGQPTEVITITGITIDESPKKG